MLGRRSFRFDLLCCAGVLLAGLAIGRVMGQGAPPPPRPPPPPGLEAQTRARQLDDLFARLKAAASQEDGEQIVAQIWQVWQHYGNPEPDAELERATLIMGQVPALA